MLELPEVLTLAKQLREQVVGQTVARVFPPTKEHKFCFFHGDPNAYSAALEGAVITEAEGFGLFVELRFDCGRRFCFNDGVNARLVPTAQAPKQYQLLIELTNGQALAFTVAMYGGIVLLDERYENTYYQASRTALSPFDPAYPAHFRAVFAAAKPTLSAKAFLATEQRFPGIGNGVLQDILFAAQIHPKRKIATLTETEQDRLLRTAVEILTRMTQGGGRDTEKDLYGVPGGYAVQLSKNTLKSGCPCCHGALVKEAYLGGSVYYCPNCQPLTP